MKQTTFKTKEECLSAIRFCRELLEQEPEQWMLEQLENFNKEESNASKKQAIGVIADSDTPIWDILKANYPYGSMPQDKIDCVESAVAQLLANSKDAEKPGLLLGKIQCGKTDTFEDIIGLAFDKGIDIAIVLTKGTKALANQTMKRMRHDFRFFKNTDDVTDSPQIFIYDIMTIWRNLKQNKVNAGKVVFICKKQTTNIEHLIDMFDSSDFLKDKKVLVIDDEADFASRNYMSVKLEAQKNEHGEPIKQEHESTLAKISRQINDFIDIPKYCRYLQVTATPYCLYLQPDGILNLNGQYVKPFKPRFTCLVPTHEKYIGGKQYFVESANPESMYSHLFHPITKKCINVLGHEDKRYIRDGASSANIYGLTYALVSYFMATAIRRIQRLETENKKYSGSAVFHVEIGKKNHDWQKRIITSLVNKIIEAIMDDNNLDKRIWMAFDCIYKDFAESNLKGRSEGLITVNMPSKGNIIHELKRIFDPDYRDYHIQVVNSDEQMDALLDEDTGELELSASANIFIGGNILDRGVTVKNMICFFYGRNPQRFQQDTVLQHARMYGARSKEDMAVTRFHTSNSIYLILKRMNELDDQLRQWFEEGRDKDEPNAVFVGFDKDIRPCAPSKIKVSNTLTIKAQKRVLPIGFWTASKTATAKTMKEIDNLITSAENYSDTSEFTINKSTAMTILQHIESMYVYDSKYDNMDHKYDMRELMCTLSHCMSQSDDKVYILHRTDRNMSRLRENGGFIDAPDDGRTDLSPARNLAIDIPVLMLIRENGNRMVYDNINFGWNDASFYWPVLVTQSNVKPAMFSIEQKANPEVVVYDNDILKGIESDDVLKLTFKENLTDRFGDEGTIYQAPDYIYETRGLKDTTAALYIEKDDNGEWLINKNVSFNDIDYKGVYSYNNGNFPFVLRRYKYLLLTTGRDAKANQMLLELADVSEYEVESCPVFDDDYNLLDADDNSLLISASDILIDRDLNNHDFVDDGITQWRIKYPIKRVLRYREGIHSIDGED
jgi:hypothetical protein